MTSGAADADQGYFPPGRSMLRRVHEQRIVGLLYGQRGLMVGAVDPVVTVGTFMSTAGAAKPFDRLVRTARVFEKTFFGTREEADRELARVHRLHQRTRGELGRPAGPYPAGTAYDALDPKQMLWTLACIADSGQTLYEELVRPLTPSERETLWQDYRRWGELFHLDRSHTPETYAEFRAWFDGRIASDEVFLTHEAREIGHIVGLEIPGAPVDRLGLEALNLLVIGSLPSRVRKMYRLRWTPAHTAAYRAAAAAHRAARPLVPANVRRGSCEVQFARVAKAEKRWGRGQSERAAAAAQAAAARA
ncbi:MAG TPA: oxygenase MpaB family protein [Solirubrobacterales bacterium]